jgi:hypothetical protein
MAEIPYDLAKSIEKKYPALRHDFADVFSVHIEATAKCQAGDTFDAKKGKTIAYSKAQLKLYNLLERVFTDVEKFFEMNKDSATQAKQMFTRYANREASFLKTL